MFAVRIKTFINKHHKPRMIKITNNVNPRAAQRASRWLVVR